MKIGSIRFSRQQQFNDRKSGLDSTKDIVWNPATFHAAQQVETID
jgi:hypothetical protein